MPDLASTAADAELLPPDLVRPVGAATEDQPVSVSTVGKAFEGEGYQAGSRAWTNTRTVA